MLSDTDMIAILEGARSHFLQLLPVNKCAISAALVAQHVFAILIMNGRMAARGKLVFREQNVAIGGTANAHFVLIQSVILQYLTIIGPQNEMGRVFKFVHSSRSHR